MRNHLPIAGWKEVISFPDWHVFHLLAKLDTGAKSSALDVAEIKELDDGRIRFRILANRKLDDFGQTITTRPSGRTRVKSSNGQIQIRYRVLTSVQIGHLIKELEFTLVSRRSMICRALLGRRALEGAFLVDSSQKYLLGPRKKAKVKNLRESR